MMAHQLDIFSQPPSFSPPVARSSDPETSHAAARDATMSASAGRLLALRTLSERGPRTDFELAEITGWQQTSIGKRRGECAAAGLVEKTEQRRPSPSGSSAIVWKITAAGYEFLRDQ